MFSSKLLSKIYRIIREKRFGYDSNQPNEGLDFFEEYVKHFKTSNIYTIEEYINSGKKSLKSELIRLTLLLNHLIFTIRLLLSALILKNYSGYQLIESINNIARNDIFFIIIDSIAISRVFYLTLFIFSTMIGINGNYNLLNC